MKKRLSTNLQINKMNQNDIEAVDSKIRELIERITATSSKNVIKVYENEIETNEKEKRSGRKIVKR